MPRTRLTKTTAPGSYPADGVTATQGAADVTNKNDLLMTGDDLLIAYNSGVSSSTVTINSAANERGRTKDITAESIAAGAVRVYGPFKQKSGWMQSGGVLHLEAAAADVKFVVVKLPKP